MRSVAVVVVVVVGLVPLLRAQGLDPNTGFARPAAGAGSPTQPGPEEGFDVVERHALAPTETLLEGIDWIDRVYFKEETLAAYMTAKVGEPLDLAGLAKDAASITDQYRARGYLNATVSVDVVDGAAGGKRAVFTIKAGDRAELKAVHIVGNERVDEAALKEGFFSRPPEPLGALTRAGLFHKPFLDQDQQRLVFNYYKRGFLEARVVDTRVVAWRDLAGIEVTLTVVEGAPFELASLSFTGSLPEGDTSESLRKRVAMKDGDVADLVTLTQQADPILDWWRDRGHPFARFEQQIAMVPPPSKDPEKKGIGMSFKLVEGDAAVVRDIRVVGNKGTMPHVFAREILVESGQPYDHQKVKLTEKQLMQTGILASAQGRAVPVPRAPDHRADAPALVDVEFVVAETTTWLLSPAVFGDANEGLIFIGVAGDRNLLGTGLQSFASVQWSSLRFLFDVSLTEPRLLGTRSSATIEAHRRELRYRDFAITTLIGTSARANYAYDLPALGRTLGGPSRLFVGGGLGLEYGGVVPFESKLLVNSPLMPQDTFRNTVELRFGFDSREGGLSPRNGLFASIDTSTAGPWTASGLSFVDATANLRAFWSPVWDITLKSNTQVGAVFNPLGDQPPVTDRYFLGGLGSVRGFFPRSIGPVQDVDVVASPDFPSFRCDGTKADDVDCTEVGGVVKLVQNLEIEVPLWPGTPFRGFAFVDVGQAYGEGELDGGPIERNTLFLVSGLMMSTGFGLLLETPVLPFRFEWSVPVTRRSFDQPINFFLGVGSAF
ncbi:MAG: BamA/TamA family outer membrane protein [Deltaproteobacteria bacterium]|nr:BamA/TamA family outer membrane protein [Deltaproteobacteria bacterium]